MEPLTGILIDIFKIPVGELTEAFDLRESEFWDSLKFMEMIASIEEAFEVELEADEIVTMTSCGNIRSMLSSKGISPETYTS